MGILEFFGILFFLIAVFIIINEKYFRIPQSIEITLMAIFVSILSLGLDYLGILDFHGLGLVLLTEHIFSRVFLEGFLIYLLFASSLHVNGSYLRKESLLIFGLTTITVFLTTLIYGTILWLSFPFIGISIDWLTALIMGSLVANTDPIAVMSIFKKVGLSIKMETLISGESLLNDGVGFTLFILLWNLKEAQIDLHPLAVVEVLSLEILGGILAGLLTGLVCIRMLKIIRDGAGAVMISISIITLLLVFANRFHFSGPLASIVLGLMVGHQHQNITVLQNRKGEFYTFWAIVDKLLVSVLFVLIGLHLPVDRFSLAIFSAAGIAIGASLVSRYLSLLVPLVLLDPHHVIQLGVQKTAILLTWSGLKGALSLALAVTLPASIGGEFLVPVIYAVVVFSIVVQGLTVSALYRKLMKTI